MRRVAEPRGYLPTRAGNRAKMSRTAESSAGLMFSAWLRVTRLTATPSQISCLRRASTMSTPSVPCVYCRTWVV